MELIADEFIDRTPLHDAARKGAIDVMQHLIAEGASVNAKDKPYCRTPLHYAAREGTAEAVELLIDKGANVHTADDEGWTALHDAAIQGSTQVVQLLVSGGASVKVKDRHGRTPLHFAVQQGKTGLVEVLIANEATVDANDKEGCTPLHYVAAQGDDAKVVVELLINNGASVHAKDNNDRDPLHLAALKGRTEVVALLIANGASGNAEDHRGLTPLHYAAEKGEMEVVKLLVTKGATVDATDDDGSTPLHLAAEGDAVELAQLLVESGAKLDAKNDRGQIPIDLARSDGMRALLHVYRAADFTITDELLGEGSEGTVFKATDKFQGKAVAVKTHSERQANAAAGRGASNHLYKEYKLLTKLKHRNIIQVLHFHTETINARNVEHQVFMEFAASGSLANQIRQSGALSGSVIQNYLWCALEGLAYLHSNNILHKDIKPSNMLVDRAGTLKLSDFGCSRELPSDRMNGEATTTKTVTGTYPYMAPEVLAGKYSEGSDLWALGCSVIPMASGRQPWSELALGAEDLRLHIKTSGAHPKIPDHLGDALQELLTTLLRQNPRDRGSAASALKHPYFSRFPTEAPLLPSTSNDFPFLLSAHTPNDAPVAGGGDPIYPDDLHSTLEPGLRFESVDHSSSGVGTTWTQQNGGGGEKSQELPNFGAGTDMGLLSNTAKTLPLEKKAAEEKKDKEHETERKHTLVPTAAQYTSTTEGFPRGLFYGSRRELSGNHAMASGMRREYTKKLLLPSKLTKGPTPGEGFPAGRGRPVR